MLIKNERSPMRSCMLFKGWFPYDRRSQIAIRSAIVCDHMETTSAIVCDPAIVIAEDRTMFYLKAGFHMIADRRSQTIAIDRRRSQEIEHGSIFCDDRRPYCDLRSAIIWKPALNLGGSQGSRAH